VVLCHTVLPHGGRSSAWLERQVVALKAGGSSPLAHPNDRLGTALRAPYTPAARASSSTAEQRTLNPQVLGSKPRGRTRVSRLFAACWRPIGHESLTAASSAALRASAAARSWDGMTWLYRPSVIAAHRRRKCAVTVCGHRATRRLGENEIVCRPAGPARETFRKVRTPVVPQRRRGRRVESDRARTRRRLRWPLDGSPTRIHARARDRRTVEIDVGPPEAEHLTAAHPRRRE
jgi:hypothetical protein